MKTIVSILLGGLLALAKPQYNKLERPLSWSVISSISLTGTSGKQQHILSSAVNVFVMLSPECPLCKNYVNVISQLQTKNPNVRYYGIFPGKAYTTSQIDQFKKEYKANFPLLIDPEKKLSKYLNATTTPESILIINTGEINYRGLIDNWAVSLGQQRRVITENYLSTAVDAVLQNKKIVITKTRPVGCRINDL